MNFDYLFGIECDGRTEAELLIAILLDQKTDEKTRDAVVRYWNDDHKSRPQRRRMRR